MINYKISFYYSLKNQQQKELFKKIIYATCLVTQNIKPAEIYTIHCKHNIDIWNKMSTEVLHLFGLEQVDLYRDANKTTLLFYKKDALAQLINNKANRIFLRTFGYRHFQLSYVLQTLKTRYQLTNCPHEIGIFLGYPINDVLGFIRNNGQNCKLCRYWKVYDDIEYCSQLFQKIDSIKGQTKALLLQLA